MSSIYENYAIVIELNDEMLENAKNAQLLMSKNLGIKHIFNESPCPHITLESGLTTSNLDRFMQEVKKSCSSLNSFSILGRGLGIFLAETPVIHVRWFNNEDLIKLKLHVSNLIKKLFSEGVIKTSNNDLSWLPKSTLAFSDTSNKDLSKILELINDIDFNKPILVNKIAVYKYSLNGGETCVDSCSFKT